MVSLYEIFRYSTSKFQVEVIDHFALNLKIEKEVQLIVLLNKIVAPNSCGGYI